MENINFRVATQEDAAEIANVHINSWRESYVGLMPQEFLDDRPLFFRNRYRLWKKVTTDPIHRTFVAECLHNGVVGFVNGSAARDKEYAEYAEVYCLYLLKKYHSKRIGRELLRMYFEEMKNKGFKKAYLWVLKDNPTTKFYEKMGGKYNGHAKEAEIAGRKMTELCYVWENLDLEIK